MKPRPQTQLGSLILLLVSAWAIAEEPEERGFFPRFSMPGKTHAGPVPRLSEDERRLAEYMRHVVNRLAGEIGPRNVHEYARLVAAAMYLEGELQRSGYEIERHVFPARGRDCWNIVAERRGSEHPEQIVVLGAHYDSVLGVAGANDNASGCAAVAALAHRFANRQSLRTIRFVLFVNEEAPWFRTEAMGSLRYANRCRERRENVVAMYSFETIGYFSEQQSSQRYPPPLSLFYPTNGDFIGFVGNVQSGPLVSWTVGAFREQAQIPSEGVALPEAMPGVGWSDHWSFWQAGYRALMVTDTAPFRYPHYHRPSDTPDKLDYSRMALVVSTLDRVIQKLASKQKEDQGEPAKEATAAEPP